VLRYSFTGSAGVAVVTKDRALLFTDCMSPPLASNELELTSAPLTARYYVQAGKELTKEWELQKVGMKDVKQWDEWLLSVSSSALRRNAELTSHFSAQGGNDHWHRLDSRRLR
jgi:hypothetical protein